MHARSTPYPLFLLFATLGVACRSASADPAVGGNDRVDAGVVEPIGSASLAMAVVTTPPAKVEATAALQAPSACPAGMVLVEGDFCPDVDERCLEWMDPPGTRYQFFRCKRYGKSVCKSKKRVHKRFFIDQRERAEPVAEGQSPDQALPLHFQSWTSAKALCEKDGARLCLASEWVFACEGEEMRPYPYGWERDSNVCNADIGHGLGRIGHLVDHRAPASAHPACVSPFGVHDMAGNVDEWTSIDGAPRGSREVMHGSWWMPGRNNCRSYQAGHGANYAGAESGARCCADAR
jgi:sulfatase modifying factor 1